MKKGLVESKNRTLIDMAMIMLGARRLSGFGRKP
jgi:hypothetical protein